MVDMEGMEDNGLVGDPACRHRAAYTREQMAPAIARTWSSSCSGVPLLTESSLRKAYALEPLRLVQPAEPRLDRRVRLEFKLLQHRSYQTAQ